MDAKHKIR